MIASRHQILRGIRGWGWRVSDREARTFKPSPPFLSLMRKSPPVLSSFRAFSSFCRRIRRVFGLGRKVPAKLSTLFAFLRKTCGPWKETYVPLTNDRRWPCNFRKSFVPGVRRKFSGASDEMARCNWKVN